MRGAYLRTGPQVKGNSAILKSTSLARYLAPLAPPCLGPPKTGIQCRTVPVMKWRALDWANLWRFFASGCSGMRSHAGAWERGLWGSMGKFRICLIRGLRREDLMTALSHILGDVTLVHLSLELQQPKSCHSTCYYLNLSMVTASGALLVSLPDQVIYSNL